MQEISRILKKVPLADMKETSAPYESSREQASTYAHSNQDHIGAINQVFAEFELAYHNQYHKAYAQDRSVGVAKKYWLSCLQGFSPEVILQATREVVASQEYLPSVAVLVQACKQVKIVPGLPTPREAYVEACCATLPKASYSWSHPIVYYAGKNTGWFELANRFEAKIFPLFEYHYSLLCQRLADGEELSLPQPTALPASGSMELSLTQKKARLAELRKQLDL